MADTTFQDRQTPILASWLNDVNRLTYDIGSNASGKGASLVGLQDVAGNFQTNNVESALATLATRVYGVDVTAAPYNADPTGTLSSTAAFVAAKATGKPVYAPPGIFRVTLDLVSGDTLFGAGPRKTLLIPETGATYVLRSDARTVPKQYITLRDFGIVNTNSVANCYGLYLQGTDVNSVNDFHTFENLYIGQSVSGGTGFLKGFYCTGRMIWSRLVGVDVCFNTGKGWHFAVDTTTPAFNSNQFIGCTGLTNAEEGFLSTGQSTYNQMVGCVFETNNTSNTIGVAGMQLHDCDSWVIDGLGLESNGVGAAVNTTTPLSNSIGLRLTGSYSYNMNIRGLYGSGSGCIVAVDATLIQGGYLGSSQLLCPSNGFSFAGISAAGNAENQQQFVFDCNTTLGAGQVKFTQDVNGNYAFCVQQSKGSHYITTAPPALNLLRMSRVVANPSGGSFTINTINNRLPGCTLEMVNIHGTNTVTIAAGLMNSGAASTVAAGTSKRYLAIGFPNEGKLVEI